MVGGGHYCSLHNVIAHARQSYSTYVNYLTSRSNPTCVPVHFPVEEGPIGTCILRLVLACSWGCSGHPHAPPTLLFPSRNAGQCGRELDFPRARVTDEASPSPLGPFHPFSRSRSFHRHTTPVLKHSLCNSSSLNPSVVTHSWASQLGSRAWIASPSPLSTTRARRYRYPQCRQRFLIAFWNFLLLARARVSLAAL